MRTICVALLLLLVMSASGQQPATSSPAFSGKLSIPAQLSHTVRADKAHPGDPVEFRTLSAVLIGNGVVMPADAHLYGRVLGAAPKLDNKNSYLLMVIERAEWKEHNLPLHAFVAAQIAVKTKTLLPPDANVARDQPSTRGGARMNARMASRSDPTLGDMVKTPTDASGPGEVSTGTNYPALEDVGIFRDKSGTTYLLSSKSSVKLPAGVLLLLRNEPGESANTTGAQPATGATTTQ